MLADYIFEGYTLCHSLPLVWIARCITLLVFQAENCLRHAHSTEVQDAQTQHKPACAKCYAVTGYKTIAQNA